MRQRKIPEAAAKKNFTSDSDNQALNRALGGKPLENIWGTFEKHREMDLELEKVFEGRRLKEHSW